MRRCTLLAAIVPLAFLPALGQQTVTVKATSKTVSWGYYGSMHPAATVHSGDTVVMQTLSTCGPADRLIARGVKPRQVGGCGEHLQLIARQRCALIRLRKRGVSTRP